jgi:hypothetical protein
MIVSETHTLTGAVDDAATRAIKAKVYLVPHVGAIAFEIVEGSPARMILKRKDDEPVDRERLAAAIADAGPFTLD